MAAPSVSHAAAASVLGELLRIDPQASQPNRSKPTELNVEALSEATGLARGTVHNALSYLSPVLRRKPFRANEGQGRRGGKPTFLYRIARNAAKVLVLDFDHDRVTAWRGDVFGDLQPAGMQHVEVDVDPKEAIALGAKLLRSGFDTWRDVVGIGLSIPAPVDPTSQKTLGRVLPSWESLKPDEELREDLRGEIGDRFETLPIIADNDGNLAALAEYRYREARGEAHAEQTSLFFVKTVPGNIGVGGGAVIDGFPLRGTGFAAEFGHLVLDGPFPRHTNIIMCPHCQRTNCLQARISTDALVGGETPPPWDEVVRRTVENVAALLNLRDKASKANEASRVAELDARLDTLASTDQNVRAIVLAGREMGRALGLVVTILDPHLIVMEGDLAQAWLNTGIGSIARVVGDPVGEALAESAPLTRTHSTDVALASATGNCGHGAAAAVLQRHLVDFILDRLDRGTYPHQGDGKIDTSVVMARANG
jgi:predicted NBD/HSP70 family sugar kinase